MTNKNSTKISGRFGEVMKWKALLGVRYAYLVAPMALSLAAVCFEGITLAALMIFVKGALIGDFSFMLRIPVIGNILSVLSRVTSTDNSFIFIFMIVIILCASLLKIFSTYFSSILSLRQLQLALSNIRKLMFKRYLSFGKAFFDRVNMGEPYSTIIHFTTSAMYQLIMLQDSLARIVMFMFYLIVMFAISWKLTIIVIISFPILNHASKLIIDKIKKASYDVTTSNDMLNHSISNILSCIPVVKQYVAEDNESRHFAVLADRLSTFEIRLASKRLLIGPLQESIFLTAGLFLISLMGFMIAIKEKSANIPAYTAFVYIMRRCQQNFAVFNNIRIVLATLKGSNDRIGEVFDDNGKYFVPDGNVIFPGLKNEIQFSHLNFSYTSKQQILKDVSFSVEKGKVIALVGPTGAGKTTVISLLLRFYDCPTGSIFIDGADIRSLSIRSLMPHIAYVSQDVLLFNDSIRNNILYGKTNPISEEALSGVISKARLSDFVASLPEGLDTHVGERGVKLSGGEKQRISIARALLKGAEILILDEATSALDTKTERLIQEAIDEALKERTAIVIAHRLSTIKNADKIVVLDEGRIIEDGGLQELLDKKGKFYEYWQEQKFF